ncbi:hypothetical protein GDO81_006449 [Engystomops pustulosus]|uniref:PiggyBac transposable element-derived protein domain-containing protein n=1 Tax=Engystomops pustulosus TaxID=76066 RepID=A0AAV7CYA1_ENGPU|nr:hypothetical protein GDO81_006449 [Engystomops pustulosus]
MTTPAGVDRTPRMLCLGKYWHVAVAVDCDVLKKFLSLKKTGNPTGAEARMKGRKIIMFTLAQFTLPFGGYVSSPHTQYRALCIWADTGL